MGFFFFLLANFVVFVRPAEAFEGLEGIQFYLIFVIFACLFGHRELIALANWNKLKSQPVTICVFGVFIAIAASHITNFYFGGAIAGMFEFFKVVVYYLLLVAMVTTPQRLRTLMKSSAIAATIMIGMSVMDYLQIMEFKNIIHVVETHGTDLLGREIKITRMCGTGMFHDPNDISLIVVVMSIFCIYFLLEPTPRGTPHAPLVVLSKVFWLFPIFVLMTGLLCTQSRGGLLAMGAALVAWSTIRYGKLPALAAICLGIIAMPILLGRQGNISLSEGTGQERIRLWSDGLVAISNHRIFFGIGKDMYENVANLVAHNSYIHSFVELGYFGGTFFFGCFFFSVYGLWKIQTERLAIYNPELERFKAYLAGILAGYCIGMCSLSRCYIPPTYLICGIATVYYNMIGLQLWPARTILTWNYGEMKKLMVASAGCLFCAFMFVKFFARFSG